MKAIAAIGTALLTALLIVCAVTGLVMLCLGAAHSYDGRVPAFGFRATFFLMLAFSLATTKGKSSE